MKIMLSDNVVDEKKMVFLKKLSRVFRDLESQGTLIEIWFFEVKHCFPFVPVFGPNCRFEVKILGEQIYVILYD